VLDRLVKRERNYTGDAMNLSKQIARKHESERRKGR
jgi:hypothetical protein